MPSNRPTAPPTIDTVLERAVDVGLIDRPTATAIAALAVADPGASPPSGAATDRRAIPAALEAIAYVGASLLAIGAVVFVGQYWDELSTAARLAVLAATTAVLAGATVMTGEHDPVRWRLRAFLGMLTAGATAAVTVEALVDAIDWRDEPVVMVTGGAVALVSLALWQWRDRPAQQATTYVGLHLGAGGVAAWVHGAEAVGLVMLLIGIGWLVAAERNLLPSRTVAGFLALVAIGVGPAVTAGGLDRVAPLIGVAVATALVAVGSWRHRFVVMVAGVAALFVYLPWTLGAWFGETIGAPAVFMISGSMMLAVVLWTSRARRRR